VSVLVPSLRAEFLPRETEPGLTPWALTFHACRPCGVRVRASCLSQRSKALVEVVSTPRARRKLDCSLIPTLHREEWGILPLMAHRAYFACRVSMYLTRLVTRCCTCASWPWLMLENSGPHAGMSWLP